VSLPRPAGLDADRALSTAPSPLALTDTTDRNGFAACRRSDPKSGFRPSHARHDRDRYPGAGPITTDRNYGHFARTEASTRSARRQPREPHRAQFTAWTPRPKPWPLQSTETTCGAETRNPSDRLERSTPSSPFPSGPSRDRFLTTPGWGPYRPSGDRRPGRRFAAAQEGDYSPSDARGK
jgi:hypothetical protein